MTSLSNQNNTTRQALLVSAVEGSVSSAPSSELNLSNEEFTSRMQNAIVESNVLHDKQIIKGVVIEINHKKGLVFIDVGLKSEGVISISEFFRKDEKENLKVGSIVEVYLNRLDTKAGGVSISRAKAVSFMAWKKIMDAFRSGETVSGVAFSRTKGGVAVDFEGAIAFLPGSQIDTRPVRDLSNIIGYLLPYKVLQADQETKTLIVSRRSILEQERSVEREAFMSTVKIGEVLEGTVKNITQYGAFIELAQVDGLLHVTDISWKKIVHPSEVLQLGDRVKVKVIKYSPEEGKISLGMKQLEENPWNQLADKYVVGTKVKGKVINITDYGAFIQIEEGIEGLLHLSEMSWVKNSHKALRSFSIGQEIETVITEFDIEKHRIALSLRRLQDNPWEKFVRNHNTGEILDGTVRNVTDFGIFVSIDGEEIDGLVHVSDISWTGDSAALLAKYNKEDRIKVTYLGSDLSTQKVKLGIKQLTNDPFQQHRELIEKDKVVTCKVVAVKEEDGIEVELFDEIRSFISKSNLGRDRSDQRPHKFAVGDRVDAKIVQYNPESRKLTLSIKALETDVHNKTMQEYGSVSSGATIGGVLGEALKVAAERNNNSNQA